MENKETEENLEKPSVKINANKKSKVVSKFAEINDKSSLKKRFQDWYKVSYLNTFIQFFDFSKRLELNIFFLYSLLHTIGSILMGLYSIIGKGKYLDGFWQRLGFLPQFDAKGKPVIWLHCVSVGETQAARPLVSQIIENFPDYKLVVSTTTKTGQNEARKVFKNQVCNIFYFPYDWKFSSRSTLRKIKPKVILIMETEIWLNFFCEAGKRGAKIVIVNGRLSEKSANGFNWFKNTFRRVFCNVNLILAQTSADACRFSDFAICKTKVEITGNIKFDQEISEAESKLADEIQKRFCLKTEFPLIIVASTHAPEEKLILKAFKILCKDSTEITPRLMIVPRHPDRFAEVANTIKDTGLIWARRSENPSEKDKIARVILLDTIGELRSVYPFAEVVFIGGSLIPQGGQNILEPAVCRKAIVTGYYTKNFKAIVEAFLAKNALIQIPKLRENEIPQYLANVFAELLQNEKKRNSMAESAFSVVEENRGATAKTIVSLKLFLDKKSQSFDHSKSLE